MQCNKRIYHGVALAVTAVGGLARALQRAVTEPPSDSSATMRAGVVPKTEINNTNSLTKVFSFPLCPQLKVQFLNTVGLSHIFVS